MYWVTFWAMFFKTHLVTLSSGQTDEVKVRKKGIS
jgi:hypothetical protein